MVIEINGEQKRYKLLHVLEFNSDRKRMSVIVREPTGRILMLCKGADSILENRMLESVYHNKTFGALQKFASMGLRTLMLAEKYISE